MAPTATATVEPEVANPQVTQEEQRKRDALLLLFELIEEVRCQRCRRPLVREQDGTVIVRAKSMRLIERNGQLKLRCPSCKNDNTVELIGPWRRKRKTDFSLDSSG
jgi:ribosomal protein S27E